MIDYKLFRFASAPRSGTTWMLKACHTIGLGEGQKPAAHVPHRDERCPVLRVSLVRNPCDWLRSYYAAVRGGSTGIDIVDRLARLRIESFERFILSYASVMPGAVGEMFKAYHADSYLRIEDMPWAFAELMESLEVPQHLRQRCYDIPKQNCSPRLPKYNSRLRRLVARAEREMMMDFDYH